MLVGIQPRSGPTQPSHEIAPGLLAIGGVLVQPLAEQSPDALDGVEIRALLRKSFLPRGRPVLAIASSDACAALFLICTYAHFRTCDLHLMHV